MITQGNLLCLSYIVIYLGFLESKNNEHLPPSDTFIIPEDEIINLMIETSQIKKGPEKQRGLNEQERKVLNDSMTRHHRTLEKLSKL